MKKIITLISIVILISCKNDTTSISQQLKPVPKTYLFGYDTSLFNVINDTIKNGESFGVILDKNHVDYPIINKIAIHIKDTFDLRGLRAGKPYTILASKDSTQKAEVFIYQRSKTNYLIVDFKDSIINTYHHKIPIKRKTKIATGIISSSLSEAIDDQGLNYSLVNEIADIYAWTIDFFHLQKDDKFKIVYEEDFIDDTTSVGIHKINYAYFEHGSKPFYAFNFVADSIKGYNDYYDDEANNLRRAFLKAPLKFGRISSRYNLRRRIAYYGNRVRAHKGTDFAAPIGTPIMSTANGTVVESRRKGGNGNYVKVKHNGTYSTQYLHMRKRNVKVGDVVKQGDVIGWIGMTGNTAGPHVCYRFWKNGSQVDPLRQKLPVADPMKETIKPIYFNFIEPQKATLDSIQFEYNEIKIPEKDLNT